MIAYFITYDLQHSRSTHERVPVNRPRAYRHAGTVSFVGRQVHLLRDDGSTFARRNKCTLFDDSSAPPRLIREDYELKQLRKLKAKLPETFIDMRIKSDGWRPSTRYFRAPTSILLVIFGIWICV